MPMSLLPKDPNGTPYLILAPMEGVGDRTFRKSMSAIGGFDEAVTEFISVPCNAHVQSLAKVYLADETYPIPLAAQLMGADAELMALMSQEMEKRGAPRIDLNCGCPSKTVTGRGAGSSLLRQPDHLHVVAKAMVQAVNVPVTLKMRSGFEDTSLFKENLLAAQESGVRYITLHPRTKVDGYGPPAKWEMIALAKTIVSIPVVGNGDILNVEDALRMLKMTNCDGLMIGRGSVINPFIFHQIRAHFAGTSYTKTWSELKRYLDTYQAQTPVTMPLKTQVNKLKQMMSFIFKGNPKLLERRNAVLTLKSFDPTSFMQEALPLLQEAWEE
jgi:tRNA-dihydrouridine synthase C